MDPGNIAGTLVSTRTESDSLGALQLGTAEELLGCCFTVTCYERWNGLRSTLIGLGFVSLPYFRDNIACF